ncbi:hypothetical protein D9758_013796 [Tetrapyrgos nigripes]|uniref:Uncharacterized protein n=1 Tax=Tetrapyrgos nigripes TaxID=182062 RepID=A0A8H5D7E6_9AGAR|nr:hypothetical protein D9758_013796 [Tetrapyrgos nigripes]
MSSTPNSITPCAKCSSVDHDFQACKTFSFAYDPSSTTDCQALVEYVPPFPAPTPTLSLSCHNKSDPVSILQEGFRNPFLRLLIWYLFREATLSKPLTDDQMMNVPDDEGGECIIKFTPEVAARILEELRLLAKMVVTAATGLGNPNNSSPPSIPRDVLELEWSDSPLRNVFPHLSLVLNPMDRTILDAHAKSRQGLQEQYAILQFVARQYARWIVDQVLRSIRKGYLSECNWGAIFGLTQDETLTLLTRRSLQELEIEKRRVEEKKAMSIRGRESRRKALGVDDEAARAGALILHPTESTMAKQGLLAPYDPTNPGWTTDVYSLSTEITEDEEDWEDVLKLVTEDFGSE